MNMTTYVIGAGVTGLSFAKVFNENTEILESRNDLGGKALSYTVETSVGKFGFDLGGHWFHHKNAPEALELLKGLELEGHKRYAYVYLDKQFLEFPIQQNYKAHSDPNFVKRIDKDLEEIKMGNLSYYNYDDMLLKSYGITLYQSFFRNYNTKMFGINDLSQLDVGRFEKVRNVRIDRNITGYNSDFVYPSGDEGAKGIPLFLSQNLMINYNKKVELISLSKKLIKINNKHSAWKNIVSTMPLTSLVDIISDIDSEIVDMAKELKSSKGLIINIAVKRNPLHNNKSWVYIPSLDFSFYRVGFYSNVQHSLAPQGYVSMYVECSPLYFQNKEEALNLVPKVIEELIEIGFIGSKEEIITSRSFYLNHNYCLPNNKISEKIRSYLERFGVYSIGRYGTWHWSSQHEDMQQAIKLAKRLIAESDVDKTLEHV
jgi:protoporphyrinogen oxidase